jgi:hypothetical protein
LPTVVPNSTVKRRLPSFLNMFDKNSIESINRKPTMSTSASSTANNFNSRLSGEFSQLKHEYDSVANIYDVSNEQQQNGNSAHQFSFESTMDMTKNNKIKKQRKRKNTNKEDGNLVSSVFLLHHDNVVLFYYTFF